MNAIYALTMDVPKSWLVHPHESLHDLSDNIQFFTLTNEDTRRASRQYSVWSCKRYKHQVAIFSFSSHPTLHLSPIRRSSRAWYDSSSKPGQVSSNWGSVLVVVRVAFGPFRGLKVATDNWNGCHGRQLSPKSFDIGRYVLYPSLTSIF